MSYDFGKTTVYNLDTNNTVVSKINLDIEVYAKVTLCPSNYYNKFQLYIETLTGFHWCPSNQYNIYIYIATYKNKNKLLSCLFSDVLKGCKEVFFKEFPSQDPEHKTSNIIQYADLKIIFTSFKQKDILPK